MKSNCCDATMKVESGNEGTSFYYCDKCGNSCDEKIPEKKFISITPMSDNKILLTNCTEAKYNGIWHRNVYNEESTVNELENENDK